MNANVNFEELVARRISHIRVQGEGIVSAILNDDLVGRRHQRFVLELARHKTILVLNNIDDFPRLDPLAIGDRVEFFGEYVWNRHGGLLHWTHPDPKGLRDDGHVRVITGAAQGASPLPLGNYRHYKGGLYALTGFAVHSETLEDLVIYQDLGGKGQTWVRPLSSWTETVEVDGRDVCRFAWEDFK